MLYITGWILVFVGAIITSAFWIPQIINRQQLRALLGSRYPLVYFVYVANGPLLLVLGLFLLNRFG